MSVMYDLINILGLFCETLIIYNFLEIVAKKEVLSKGKLIVTWAMLIVVQILFIIFIKQQIVITAALFVSMIVMSLFFRMNWFARILSSVIILALFMIGEMLTGLLLSLIYRRSVEAINESVILYFQGVIFSKLFMIIILKIYAFCRRTKILRPSLALFLIMLTQPIATCLAIYLMSVFLFDENDRTRILLMVVVSILLVVANIIMFYLMEYQMNENEKRNKRQLLNQQMEYKTAYYKELAERQRESNKTLHDLKNQLFALNSILTENSQAGIEKLNEICDSVMGKNSIVHTGKDAIDSLLCAKYQQMSASGIVFKHSIFMKENNSVSMFDLCIVLGNLIDNAIEANERIDKECREINLEMRQNGDYLYVKISNPLNGKLSIENGKIKTTKKDTIFHGFGLESIEEIAKKYSGSVTYKQKNDFFIAIVLLSNI